MVELVYVIRFYLEAAVRTVYHLSWYLPVRLLTTMSMRCTVGRTCMALTQPSSGRKDGNRCSQGGDIYHSVAGHGYALVVSNRLLFIFVPTSLYWVAPFLVRNETSPLLLLYSVSSCIVTTDASPAIPFALRNSSRHSYPSIILILPPYIEQLALTEVSYATVRLMQEFQTIESRDPEPWQECLTLTCSSANGTKVALIPKRDNSGADVRGEEIRNGP